MRGNDASAQAVPAGIALIVLIARVLLCLPVLALSSAMALAAEPSSALVEAQAARFVDDAGRDVVVRQPFQRIISLYAAHTENLYCMGGDEALIGVTVAESHPPESASKPGFSWRDDAERFIAARPDLVLLRPMTVQRQSALIAQLEQAGIAVVALQPTGVETLFTYWRRLGLLCGRTQQAERMIAHFQADLDRIAARVATIPRERRVRVFFEAIHSQTKTFAPESLAIFALTRAGGVNVAPDAVSVGNTNIAVFGLEPLLARGASIDVYLAQHGHMNKVSAEDIARTPGYAAIKAVNTGRIHLVDEALCCRPTPRLIRGVEAIGRALYPEHFGRPGE